MPTTSVIDLSHWNTVDKRFAIDPTVLGVIHKCTEGADYVDPTYSSRRSEFQRVGMLWGAYHFLRPGDMIQQASFFVANALVDNNTLLAADHEDPGVSLDDLKLFLATVRELSGRSPVLYSGSVIKEQIGADRDATLAQYRLWLSHYTSGGAAPSWPVSTWPTWWLWQFTGSGTCNGIVGDCDCNAYSRKLIHLSDEWSGAPADTPDDKVVQITIDMEVLAPTGVEVQVIINGQNLPMGVVG